MNITGGSYVMGLGPDLVVVKRNSQGIEVAPRSTKGRRKVRVLLHTPALSHNVSGPVLTLLFRPDPANSKYPLQTPRLDTSCYNRLAPSRHFLASTHVTLTRMGMISSVLRGNLPRKFVTKIRPTIPQSQRRSAL